MYRPHACPDSRVQFKIYSPGKPITLSDVLPMLEKMGFRVHFGTAVRSRSRACQGQSVWIHDFVMERVSRTALCRNVKGIKDVFEEAFAKVWHGEMESDGLNKLVLRAKMNWREIVILRTYLRYLRQVGLHYSREFIENTLADNPKITTFYRQTVQEPF
jgi:glutamate dehydrogenase